MALHDLQGRLGFVPRESAMKLGREMDVPLARIYEVVTFYNYFKLEAPGKYIISVCTGTACHIKGSAELLKGLEKELKVSRRPEHAGQGVPPAGRALPGLLRTGAPGFGQRQGLRQAEDQ